MPGAGAQQPSQPNKEIGHQEVQNSAKPYRHFFESNDRPTGGLQGDAYQQPKSQREAKDACREGNEATSVSRSD